MNWWCQEKIEIVGEWKVKVYEVQNVFFSFWFRKVSLSLDNDGGRRDEQVFLLEFDEEEGFFVVDNLVDFGFFDDKG